MKKFWMVFAIVFAIGVASPRPASAEVLTTANLKNLTFGSPQLNALIKPRLVAFEANITALATLISNLASTASGKGASLIGIYDVATKITATTVEGALAEIAADNWVTSARIAAGAVTFADQSLNACTMGQAPAVNAGATAWECSTPATGDITGVTVATNGGLEGGGASGAVTVGLLTTCMDNQILKWDTVGSVWGCEADQDTTYAVMVGDTGTGGTAGLVPAPAAGDAAAGKYLKADGTWTAPAGGLATSTSVTTATIIGSVSVTRVAASTGTVAITGSSKRTGDLKVEITTAGEADAACRFKYQFGSEALSGELVCGAAAVALGTTGLSAAFTNGAPLSFEDGDVFSSAISWETSLSGFDCGLITIPAMNTPGTPLTVETVYVHWDATRIADATVPVISSVHSAAAGMFLTDTKATAAGEARFGVVNFAGSDWTDETGIVTLCRP